MILTMQQRNKAPLVCSVCGAVILLTGVITHIISRDGFSLFLIISGTLVIIGGIIWLIIISKLPEKPQAQPETENALNNYTTFFARLADNIGLGKIYKRKQNKFRRRLSEIIKAQTDIQTRAFAAYLYYVHGMDKRFKKYGGDKVLNCIYELIMREEKESLIDNIPEGMTFCNLVEKALKNEI